MQKHIEKLFASIACLSRYFNTEADPSDRFKRDLGFKLTAEFCDFFTHYLLLLTAGCHLILLSEIWLPV